jgi:hypothetical protein
LPLNFPTGYQVVVILKMLLARIRLADRMSALAHRRLASPDLRF